MPFNSRTYYRNKHRRDALELLARARDAKACDRGADNIASYVRFARSQWKMYLSYLSLKRCDDDLKRLRRGEMRYSEFMAKWDTRQ